MVEEAMQYHNRSGAKVIGPWFESVSFEIFELIECEIEIEGQTLSALDNASTYRLRNYTGLVQKTVGVFL